MSDTNAQPITPTAQQPSEPENKLSQLEQIDQLLSGKPKAPEKAPATPEPGGDPKPGEHDVQDPNASQETEQAEEEGATGIDYAQEVPLSNGEKLSIGALKDFYQGYAQKELAMVERENSLMTRTNELQELSQYLQLPDEARQVIAQQQTQYLREQHGLMLQAIPEWKEQAVFEQARGQIFDLGKEYGVDLSRVADHRVVKMLNDYAKLRASIRKAKDTVKPIKTTEPRPPVRQPAGRGADLQTAITKAKTTGNVADQLSAVDMLLKG